MVVADDQLDHLVPALADRETAIVEKAAGAGSAKPISGTGCWPPLRLLRQFEMNSSMLAPVASSDLRDGFGRRPALARPA
jgi:hypothetical protein